MPIEQIISAIPPGNRYLKQSYCNIKRGSEQAHLMSKEPVENERRQAQRQSRRFADRAHNELMKIRDRQVSRDEFFTQTALGFLNAEAVTGLTLARLATDRTDEDARARNRRHAREAYNSVVKYHHTAAHANDEALEELDQKIEKLREMLKALGEHL